MPMNLKEITDKFVNACEMVENNNIDPSTILIEFICNSEGIDIKCNHIENFLYDMNSTIKIRLMNDYS